jgi:hypothetical protein
MATHATAALTALPTIASGLSLDVLRRCWHATPADKRIQRQTILESSVWVESRRALVAVADLSLAEVEERIGAVTPKFFVRFYDPKRTGTQVLTFVNKSDADAFAKSKTLYGEPAKVEPLGSAQ